MENPISPKLTFFITIISILIPIILWGVDRESYLIEVKRLESEALTQFVDKESGLEFVYLGDAVANPTLNRFHIENSGSEPINKADFDKPIRLTMDEDILVLNAYVASTFPKSMSVNLVISGNAIEIEPLLLNSNDIINISILTSGVPKEVSLSGRVARVADLELEDTDFIKSMYPTLVWRTVSLTFAGIMYLYFSFAAFFSFRYKKHIKIPSVFCVVVALISLSSFQFLYNNVTRIFGIESEIVYWGLVALQGVCAWFAITYTTFYQGEQQSEKTLELK